LSNHTISWGLLQCPPEEQEDEDEEYELQPVLESTEDEDWLEMISKSGDSSSTEVYFETARGFPISKVLRVFSCGSKQS
jgi:hypothetical protein